MNKENVRDFQLLKIEKGKYFVQFSNLDFPVEMNKYFYNQLTVAQNITGSRAA